MDQPTEEETAREGGSEDQPVAKEKTKEAPEKIDGGEEGDGATRDSLKQMMAAKAKPKPKGPVAEECRMNIDIDMNTVKVGRLLVIRGEGVWRILKIVAITSVEERTVQPNTRSRREVEKKPTFTAQMRD